MYKCSKGCRLSTPCDHMRSGGVGKAFGGGSDDDIVILIDDDSSKGGDWREIARRFSEIGNQRFYEHLEQEALERKERQERADSDKRNPPYAMACSQLMYVGQKLVEVEPWI